MIVQWASYKLNNQKVAIAIFLRFSVINKCEGLEEGYYGWRKVTRSREELLDYRSFF